MKILKRLVFIFLLWGGYSQAFAVCSPILGLGSVQLFDNNGTPLPNGVLYSYQAGTTTQQATYTDATCTVPNNNPITMTSGGRANIWLSGSLIYKFVACLQNDGPVCAPADVLFSVDNVPGVPLSAGSPFIGTFISGSSSPATSGILELASGDSICWRNLANSANLCLAKDTSDVLSWAGGDVKFPEISCSATGIGFDYLCADSTQHRWTMFNNNGIKTQVVGAGVDINNSDQVNQFHFGAQATPLSSVAVNAGQSLIWNGTNIVGGGPSLVVANAGATGTTVNTLTKLTGAPSTAVIATTTDVGGIVGITVSGAGTTGSAIIAQSGSVSCVFDGATTAGHYVGISTTIAGNCHDVGASYPSGQAIGRVLSTNGGVGTYSIALFPPEERLQSVISAATQTTTGTAINASDTTWVTKAVTMPSSGCPCRAFVSYGIFFDSTGSGTLTAWVKDDTGSANYATAQALTNSASSTGPGVSASAFSTNTYSNGATVTFTGHGWTNAAGSVTVSAPNFGSSQNPWLNVAIFGSN